MTTSGVAAGRTRYDLDSLLDVAARTFTERGYDGTSMEDLSRATGLSKSSLYHHVRGKEHLLRLALERAVDPLYDVLREAAEHDGTAVERLEYVFRREVEVLADRLPYVTLLLRVRGNTETERWALDQRRRFDAAVTELVEAGVAESGLRTDLDAATVTRLAFGMINSLTEWYRAGRGSMTAAELADHVVAVLFAGLRTRDL